MPLERAVNLAKKNRAVLTVVEVLQEVDCSVLAVKPDGFVTPVRLKE